MTGRVKSVASIEEKIALRGLSVENLAQDMQDIAGLRVMVQFVDDVDEVLDLLRHRSDMTIVSERDYIRNRKNSGYRSYHVIISYPVDTIDGRKEILAEIQIRTLAMNFWATIEPFSLITSIRGIFLRKLNFAWKLRPAWLMSLTKKCGRYVMILEKPSCSLIQLIEL